MRRYFPIGDERPKPLCGLQILNNGAYAGPGACINEPTESRPARYQAIGALAKPGSRRAVPIGGPLLSILPPCFGQTGVKPVAKTTFSHVNPPAAALCADIGLSTERPCI